MSFKVRDAVLFTRSEGETLKGRVTEVKRGCIVVTFPTGSIAPFKKDGSWIPPQPHLTGSISLLMRLC